MGEDKNAFKAGVFILLAIAVAGGLLVAIRGTGRLFVPMHEVRVAFTLDQNLGGLKVGDPLRIGGFDQGRVTEIEFVPRNGDAAAHLEIVFSLAKKYDLRTDAVVQVEQGLTGIANLNISDFGTKEPWREGTTLVGRPSAFSALLALGGQGGALLDEVRSKIGPGYKRYEEVTDRVGAVMGQAKDIITNLNEAVTQTRADIKPTLDNIASATGTLKEKLPGSIERANRLLDEASQTVSDVRAAMRDVSIAAANTRDATAEARAILIRNHTKVDNIIGSLRDTSINLENASEEVRRSPWRLFYQPSKDELGNLNIYDSTRLFARAAAQLNDAAGAVRDAARDPGIDKAELDAVLQTLQQTFTKYRQVEETLWQAVK